MKTEMTKTIERSLSRYFPASICGIKINKFRDQHTAFEVPVECGTTSAGIVDCVRVAEYFGDLEQQNVCIAHRWKNEGIRRAALRCERGVLDSDGAPLLCDERKCTLNAVRTVGTQKVLIACFEIKITKADFKSRNGHNFVGNLNYYVVPKEIYEDIKDLVPEDIGIILYISTDKFSGLRKKKECAFREMSDEDQKWMLLSVMKRIRAEDWKKQWEEPEKGADPWATL